MYLWKFLFRKTQVKLPPNICLHLFLQHAQKIDVMKWLNRISIVVPRSDVPYIFHSFCSGFSKVDFYLNITTKLKGRLFTSIFQHFVGKMATMVNTLVKDIVQGITNERVLFHHTIDLTFNLINFNFLAKCCSLGNTLYLPCYLTLGGLKGSFEVLSTKTVWS